MSVMVVRVVVMVFMPVMIVLVILLLSPWFKGMMRMLVLVRLVLLHGGLVDNVVQGCGRVDEKAVRACFALVRPVFGVVADI